MTNTVLSAIATDCQSLDHAKISTMPGDKWLLSSAFQKSIRRGEKDYALQAAKAFWTADKRGFWRRLHIIALEDVGAASPDTVVAVLSAFSCASWRKQVGDLQAGLYLTGLLCEAVKTRFADQLFIQLNTGWQGRALFADMKDWSKDKLICHALNRKYDIKNRALAVWLIAGTKAFPAENFSDSLGCLQVACDILRALNGNKGFNHACANVLKATQYPLALFSPLILQSISAEQAQIQNFELGTMEVEGGIPLCAADVFTRIGRQCYKILQAKVPDLRQFTIKQIGIGQFYLEGGLIDKTLTNPTLDGFRLDGELADAETVGLCPSRYLGLADCLQENGAVLADIRRVEIRKYLRDWRERSLIAR